VSCVGKSRRLRRLLSPITGRGVFLPIDQPLTVGPLPGLADPRSDVPRLLAGRPDAVVAHRGLIAQGLLADSDATIVQHLSAATELSHRATAKTLLTDVEDALRLGADAVSVHISFGDADERSMLAAAGRVAAHCSEWGVPLLVMAYVVDVVPEREPAKIAHAARVAAELGADIVKVPYTGSAASLAEVVSACFVPVIVAGGAKNDWSRVLTDVRAAMAAGARGVCVGRNVFQHDDAVTALAELRAEVHGCPAMPTEPRLAAHV
jgi:predicted phospho-2-dehydro-3-deoxyheptonate aldolase